MPKRQQARLMQGNEAIAYGALAAGCDFFAGYPITPASEITEIMSRELPKKGNPFIQMEDEIASVGCCLGASLTGRKAMTATSGPGFSLMQENLGYGCIAEIPMVLVNVMRAGPSTGLPTNVAQGDVQQARWGTHGDHPAIVLCPSSVAESYELTVLAFNHAERYRTPVILLSDETVAHMREKVSLPKDKDIEIINRRQPTVPPDWYTPYKTDGSLIPRLADLGEGYRYHVTGLVHDERGFPTRRVDEVEPFYNRMFEKISRHFKDLQYTKSYSMEDADLAIIAYGCTARSARAAVRMARERGIKVGLLQLLSLWPFPRQAVEMALEGKKAVIVPELNMGQMAREVKRVNAGRTSVYRHSKMDGTMITPDEILSRMREVL
ncbi:2-oxoacid:acceptor oxidoreductase subunit alpha [Dethiosulfatarculus sandiegensis]|uniref:2-oxoacid:acceptor oxidoreductase subunit alpha n=1 Tax=Dethiosulfatarculus sandiegensis TaxID=1429043 RepID=UPI000AA968D4|nr:2-oxoacid:acceptor oxidoreductase subunit alpha [Dethiosulfatarculus sandiegensis]